jgi:hypothetical protein
MVVATNASEGTPTKTKTMLVVSALTQTRPSRPARQFWVGRCGLWRPGGCWFVESTSRTKKKKEEEEEEKMTTMKKTMTMNTQMMVMMAMMAMMMKTMTMML